jgi:hypothetical protein
VCYPHEVAYPRRERQYRGNPMRPRMDGLR